MAIRKTVMYKPHPEQIIEPGYPAVVWPIDHTSDLVSNTTWVITSKVQIAYSNGEFETENSHYYPLVIKE